MKNTTAHTQLDLDVQRAETRLKGWGAKLEDYDLYRRKRIQAMIDAFSSLLWLVVFFCLGFIVGVFKAIMYFKGWTP